MEKIKLKLQKKDKDKVAEEQLSSAKQLLEVIKKKWVTGICADYCQTFVQSMPRRLEAVIKNKKGITNIDC